MQFFNRNQLQIKIKFAALQSHRKSIFGLNKVRMNQKRKMDLSSRVCTAAIAAALVATLVLAGLTKTVEANGAGVLDPTFSNDGQLTTNFLAGTFDSVSSLAFQTDGKIVAAGSAQSTIVCDFGLARYLRDGTLDPTFGAGGKVSTNFNGNIISGVTDVVLQPDGKIVAAGGTGSSPSSLDFALARYLSDGSLDTGFGSGGKVVTEMGGDEYIVSLVLQPDGKLVVAGTRRQSASGFDFVLARYLNDGSLDMSFDGDGKVTLSFFEGSGHANAVVLMPDGKLVVGGYSFLFSPNLNNDFTLVRLNSDGSLDTTFGQSGKIFTDFTGSNGNDYLHYMALQPDGKLVAVGYSYSGITNTAHDFAIARYHSDGNLDSTFGVNGKVNTDFTSGSSEVAYAVAFQPDGKILVVGEYFKSGESLKQDILLACYQSDGSLDTAFGLDGKVTADFFERDDRANTVAVQADGRIVVAGYTFTDPGDLNKDFALLRYRGTPRSRADFDGDGKTDLSVFRPGNGVWHIFNSSNGDYLAQPFGDGNDKLTPGDYEGDGKADIAVFREGAWYILNSSDNAFRSYLFGLAGDIPVAADYDGDGKTDLAVFRPSNNTWYIQQSLDQTVRAHAFGLAGDQPVTGDYDGDGKADVAVFRQSNGVWYFLQSSDGSFRAAPFGSSGDRPVQGDYDADGKTDFAVFRPSNGVWYILRSAFGFTGQKFGLSTDQPVPGDYDADGKTDLAVYRNGLWFILQSSDGTVRGAQFGTVGDVPVPSGYIP